MLPEIAHYLDRIDDLRRQISELITQVPAEALNWRPIDGDDDHATNSLAVLAAHVAGAAASLVARSDWTPTAHPPARQGIYDRNQGCHGSGAETYRQCRGFTAYSGGVECGRPRWGARSGRARRAGALGDPACDRSYGAAPGSHADHLSVVERRASHDGAALVSALAWSIRVSERF